jgi:chemotaxis methyl-accepting protein methylase
MPSLNTSDDETMRRKLLGLYLLQLRRIWRHLPDSFQRRPAGLAFGRHLDRIVRIRADRSQHFATFFLRNRAELALLRRLVEQKPQGARVNMTILACSKGAEVYSMAWIIRSARPDLDLRINAVDISPEIAEFASRGVYSMRKPQDQDIPSEEAVRNRKDVASIPSSDKYAWLFERVSPQEIDSMFEVQGDQATVRPWLRNGITWQAGDAGDPELPARLGPQDIVVANRFLCHMLPPDAERCLRNIGRFVKPGGYLFVYGLDLDVRTKIALEAGWTPLKDSIREIHEGDESLRNAWPLSYWGLEPLDDRRPDWQLRYASVFRIGAPSADTQQPSVLEHVQA